MSEVYVPEGLSPCPEHPQADVRHEWTRKQYVMNGYPSGRPIDIEHDYFCSDCGRKLELAEERTHE